MDPQDVIELQPTWSKITPDTLEGLVTVYVDLLDEHGYINQKDPEVPVTFKRSGSTPDECTGRIELKVPDYALILAGKTPMLYGPTGDPLRNVDGVLVAEGFDTHDCDTVFFDVGQWSWGEVFDQVQSALPDKHPIYQFQQNQNGDLWAIPIEPVHPDTRGMFIHPDEKTGGYGATPSDTCWCCLPFDSDLGKRSWFYREGATGTYYTAKIVDVLNAAVGPDNLALNPVAVPVGEPVDNEEMMNLWQIEKDMQTREPEEMNLGPVMAKKIIGGEPIDGLKPEDIVECSDGSGRTCYMLPPDPVYDSWRNDRERCTPS